MDEIQELIERVETKIVTTPTGGLRDLLCDINIVLHQQIINISIIEEQGKQLASLMEKFQTSEGNYMIRLLMNKLENEK